MRRSGSGLRPIVLCGDGAFQMTGPEISHAPNFGVNPIVLVINNGGWGIFRPVAERRELLEIPPWPYANLAREWGGAGFEAAHADRTARCDGGARISDDRFSFIDVRVERDDLSPVTVKYIKAAAKHSQTPVGKEIRVARLAATIEMDNYWNTRYTIDEFQWNTPEYFNFGNVIDEFSADHNRVALLWEDQEGNRAHLTFGDFKEQSNRIANVLKELGIGAGDPILLVLPRIPIWQAAYIGALKVGAIVVPCTAMLRQKDLVYRANHSGAKAIIASVESATMIGDLRGQCPTLAHYLIVGAARSGWKSLPEEMKKASAKFTVAKTRAHRSCDLLLHLRHHQGTQGRPACA